MPRWLMYLLASGALSWWALLLLVGVPFVLSHVVVAGEKPLDRDERAYLEQAFPGGTYKNPSTYRWCDGRIFQYFDSRGATYHFNEPCWKQQ